VVDKKAKLSKYYEELEQINNQRRYWLMASSLVFVAVVLVVAFWNYLMSLNEQWIWWLLFSASVLISMNWWYWTMGYIRKSLIHQLTVVEILADITYDIHLVKEDVRKLTKPFEESK